VRVSVETIRLNFQITGLKLPATTNQIKRRKFLQYRRNQQSYRGALEDSIEEQARLLDQRGSSERDEHAAEEQKQPRYYEMRKWRRRGEWSGLRHLDQRLGVRIYRCGGSIRSDRSSPSCHKNRTPPPRSPVDRSPISFERIKSNQSIIALLREIALTHKAGESMSQQTAKCPVIDTSSKGK